MTPRALSAALVLAAALYAPGAALACGVCIDDKVAATYDHAIVSRAAARGQVVVFAEPHSGADAALVARKLAASASHVRGIDPATIRTAQSPPSFSFALDPRVAAPDRALGLIAKSSGVPGLRLTQLKVLP